MRGCLASLDTAEPSLGMVGPSRKHHHPHRKAQFRVFNLGNTQPVKVSDFVGILEQHLGVAAKRR